MTASEYRGGVMWWKVGACGLQTILSTYTREEELWHISESEEGRS
jgi:hypothetical protein